MHSKVSSDCLPSYIKVTRPVLEIFKMAGYFPDSPRNFVVTVAIAASNVLPSDMWALDACVVVYCACEQHNDY